MRTSTIKFSVLIILSFQCGSALRAQFSLSAQLRARTEFRDGQGTPFPKGAKPALFTSQRTRITALFSAYRVKLGMSLQDVRVWGQDVSTINRFAVPENNGLLLHEAWAEIQLTDTAVKTSTLNLKVGRQELVYDDQRLIGNLDWLQQARRHDAAVLKYELPRWTIHLAAAYNQNKESNSKMLYNNTSPGSYTASTNGSAMYKSFEFLYAKRKLKKGNISFLFFSDQFSRYHIDSVKFYDQGTWARATTGLYLNNTFGKVDVTASAYHQFGKNYLGTKVSADLLSGFAQYRFDKFSAGLGIDYTSGGGTGTRTKAFDPLYGTPHKFWGLMDYFYAASPFGNGGLVDCYLKFKFKASERMSLSADLHDFASASALKDLPENTKHKNQLGQEADLVGSFNLTRLVNLECGYAHFFSNSVLSSPGVKNVANARQGANWMYLMLTIKPEFLFK